MGVTVQEIRNRLVMGGADKSLTSQHILSAMDNFNRREQFLKRRKDRDISYYRPPDFEDKCPDDQRWKESGLPDRSITPKIMPPVDGYLKSNPDTQKLLTDLNTALFDLEEKESTEIKDKGETTKTKSSESNTHASSTSNNVTVASSTSNNNELGTPTPTTHASTAKKYTSYCLQHKNNCQLHLV